MKKKLLAAVLLVCLVPASLLMGQYNSLGAFGSYCMPMSPEMLKDYWQGGIGYGAEFKLGMSETSGIVATFHSLNMALNSDKFLDEMGAGDMGIEIEGGSIIGYAITANFMKYFSPPSNGAALYLTAGGGYYSFKPDDMTMSFEGESEDLELADEAETGFGINGGLGFEFGMGSFSIFVEGRYHYTFIEDEVDEEFESEGGNFSLVTIKGGIRFTL